MQACEMDNILKVLWLQVENLKITVLKSIYHRKLEKTFTKSWKVSVLTASYLHKCGKIPIAIKKVYVFLALAANSHIEVAPSSSRSSMEHTTPMPTLGKELFVNIEDEA